MAKTTDKNNAKNTSKSKSATTKSTTKPKPAQKNPMTQPASDDVTAQPTLPQTDPTQIEADETPEGIENYPFDDLLIRADNRAIQDVLRRMKSGKINLNPEYQRSFVWPADKQSRLIESVLMRIPLQVVYLAETSEDGDLSVVDGLQRLTSLELFNEGKLTLDLPSRPEIHGKTVKDLSQKLRERFEDGQLTLYTISSKVPLRVQLDIFERVNGGTPLTRQQMRNAIYSGAATRLLIELTGMNLFRDVTGSSVSSEANVRAMKDREIANRFLAFYRLGWRQYLKTSFDDFLGRALHETNDVTREQVIIKNRASIRNTAIVAFGASLRLNKLIFGDHAFRKSLVEPEKKRSAFNVAMYDVFSASLARYDESLVTPTKAKAIFEATKKLLDNQKFHDAVTFATLKPSNVQTRFELAEEMLTKILGAPTPPS